MNSDATSAYLLVLGLLTAFALAWVTRQQRTKQDASIWLMSGFIGLLLGAAGATALVFVTGHKVTTVAPARTPDTPTAVVASGGPAPSATNLNGAISPPMIPMGTPGGAPGGAPAGGIGGGMGGGRGPSPKRQLTTLVRKLELLTGDIALVLTDDQRKEITQRLSGLSELTALTDEEAEKLQGELLGLLDDNQKAKQEAIGLPFRRGGGGPGGASGFGGGGGGGPQAAPDANPFADEENAKPLATLLDRLK